MNINRPFFVRYLFMLVALFSGIFLTNITEVTALDEQSLIVGDIIALGNVDMQVMENQSIKLNGSAMPVFSESKITTSDGQATLSLSDKALIEISKETTLYVNSDNRFIYVKIEKGGIRYLLPSNSNTLIETPLAVIGDGSYKVASSKDLPVLINNSDKVGKVFVKNDSLSFINALKGDIKVTPLSGEESTIVSSGELLQVAQLEKVSLPTPIPSLEPKEGYFWGWISEKGAWEQVELGVAPPTQSSLYIEDLRSLPKGYVWGWDISQMRRVWLKVKDGDIVIKRVKSRDKLGNLYWKEVTRSSPVDVKTAKIKSAKKSGFTIPDALLGGLVVGGAIASLVSSGDDCSGASPSC